MDEPLHLADVVTVALDAPPAAPVVRPVWVWARVGAVSAASFVVAGRAMGGRTLSRPPTARVRLDVSLDARPVAGVCVYAAGGG